MAVLSVSAPVPAVVGIVISLGNFWFGLIIGAGRLYSKSHISLSFLAMRQINLPPSIALPPPIAMIASWPPALKTERPLAISSSRGLGEMPANTSDPNPTSVRKPCN